MNKFNFTPLTIKDIILVVPKKFEDVRGFFSETYNKKEFSDGGIHEDFIQDSFSFSKKNVIRGLHFSNHPHEAAKLIRCVKGEILDIAVDIRPESKTFGKWVSETLSEENGKMLFIPKGFAHGFCVLSDVAAVAYKVTEYYYPESKAGIIWNDPHIGIPWPIQEPILSDEDKSLDTLKDIIKKTK